MRPRSYIIAAAACLALWIVSSFFVGRGCVVTVNLDEFTQHNAVEYVIPNTDIAIWRRDAAHVDNPLLDLLRDRYATNIDASGTIEIARFNAMWKDGHSIAYYPLVRERDRWINWTVDNPVVADYSWPRFLRYLDSNDPSRANMVLWYASQFDSIAEIEDAIARDPEMRTSG